MIAGTVGVLLGIKIAELTGSIAQGYVVIAVVMLLLSVPYVLGSRDLVLPHDHELAPMDWRRLLRSSPSWTGSSTSTCWIPRRWTWRR